MSHITGGGLANNLARVLPETVTARLERGSWRPPAVFDLVQRLGQVSQPDLEATLNMGVGMVGLVPAEVADAAVRLLTERGVPAWVCGELVAAGPEQRRVVLSGSHKS